MPPKWVLGQLELLDEYRQWIDYQVARQRDIPFRGGHDEGTFTATWPGYYLLTGDEKVLDFLRGYRDSFLDYARKNFHHGYWKQGEVHHHTETFNDFLSALALVDEKEKAKMARIYTDVAEHLGNWVGSIPEWFDWENNRFRSWHLGTEVVGETPADQFETLDLFRFVLIGLDAYRLTGKARYLDWAKKYTLKWCSFFDDGGKVPGILFNSPAAERIYQKRRGKIKSIGFIYNDMRISAGGLVDVLLRLYAFTKEEKFKEYARRAIAQLQEFYQGRASGRMRARHSRSPSIKAGPVRLIFNYRLLTGDDYFDELIRKSLQRIPPEPEGEPLLITAGGGFHWARMDDKGRIRPDPSPWSAFLVLGYVVTGDQNLLVRAQRQAAERLRIGSRILKLGRDHGCSIHSQSGVARNEFFALAPVVLGATLRRVSNVDSVQVKYFKADGPASPRPYGQAGGSVGLPQGTAARFIPGKPNERKVHLYNASERKAVLYVSPESTELGISAARVNARAARPRAGKVRVEIPAGKSARVVIKLA